MKRIKLLAVDVDGCITRGEGEPADLDVLSQIQEFNVRSASEPDVPAVTLCTGRQQPFVDLLSQMIASTYPAIFENGAGLHFPVSYEFLFHPSITRKRRDALVELKSLVESKMIATGTARLQPGKEVSLSLYPNDGSTVADNERVLRELIERAGVDFFLDVSIPCINVLFPGIDKGAGIRWLARETGIDPSEMGAVGDSPGDLFSLAEVGFPACPANAVEEVREAADFVAPRAYGHGVIDVINEAIKRNASAAS